MDDDTVDEPQFSDEPIDTVPDNLALEVGDDTVVTSAAPPEHEDSPWADHLIRGAVYFASGSTRIA
jgi:hypothetical protein